MPIAATTGAHPINDGAGLADFMSKNGPGSTLRKGVGGMMKGYLDPHTFAHPGEGGGGTQMPEENNQQADMLKKMAKGVAAKTAPARAAQPSPTRVAQPAQTPKPGMSIE